MAKVLDDRPVLVYSFNTQQISVIKDSNGRLIDGDEVIFHLIFQIIILIINYLEYN